MDPIDKFTLADQKIIDLRTVLRRLDLSEPERTFLLSQVKALQDYIGEKSWELELKQKAGKND